jgi:hypothetical protein
MNSAGNVNGEDEAPEHGTSKGSGVNEMLSAAMKEEEDRKKKEKRRMKRLTELNYTLL